MAEDLIATVRLLVADSGTEVEEPPPPRQPIISVDASVVRLVRTSARTTWRVVKDRTGLTEANAKWALTAARKKLSTATLEPVYPHGEST
jgi:hypothetical protein